MLIVYLVCKYTTPIVKDNLMFKISFYVPENDVDKVKEAMFNAGAGKLGNYDYVAWQTLGTGQFRSLNGSRPTIGTLHELSYVIEYKVEMLCEEQKLAEVIQALKKAHPYETPAFDVIKLYEIF